MTGGQLMLIFIGLPALAVLLVVGWVRASKQEAVEREARWAREREENPPTESELREAMIDLMFRD